MDLPFVFDLIATLAVVFGIALGLIQLRQYHLSRKREASLFLLSSYQTKEFTEGLWTIQQLPDNLTRAELESRLGDDLNTIGLVMSTWETIGILLFNHEITLDMVDDAFSGPILFSWQKLETYVNELRRDLNRETLFEWFQWLSDRMKEREESRSPVPAHIAHQDWH
jgi:hypothetical protein